MCILKIMSKINKKFNNETDDNKCSVKGLENDMTN